MRDGDAVGLTKRKAELEEELKSSGLEPRGVDERISTPVPTWSIETWLLSLLGETSLTESQSFKTRFSQVHRSEREALREAVKSWARPAPPAFLPSLTDGWDEIEKLSNR
jgi:hypothetical protein